MDWALFAGLIAIALAVFFGLWGARRDVSSKLSDIRDRIIIMSTTLEKAWQLISLRFSGETRTVERNLKNLGKTNITARPDVNMTTYLIKVTNPVLQNGLISKLSKESGLENKEKELFGGQIPKVYTPISNQLNVNVPSTEPRICTEYISLLLKWLDSTYFEELKKIKDYEESIKV